MTPEMRVLRRWPPLLWIPVYVASLLILMGGRGRWDLLAAGGLIAVGTRRLALHLALRRDQGPRPSVVVWAVGGVIAFYVVCAIAAAAVEPVWGLVTLAAGVVPLTAVALLVGMLRRGTVEHDGRLVDRTAEDHTDPFPRLGFDDDTPMGATPEHAGRPRDAEGDEAPRWERPAETKGRRLANRRSTST